MSYDEQVRKIIGKYTKAIRDLQSAHAESVKEVQELAYKQIADAATAAAAVAIKDIQNIQNITEEDTLTKETLTKEPPTKGLLFKSTGTKISIDQYAPSETEQIMIAHAKAIKEIAQAKADAIKAIEAAKVCAVEDVEESKIWADSRARQAADNLAIKALKAAMKS